MELQLIRSFLEVAESGSFAAASDRLFVTQSAVSLRIQRLEDQLGRPLFNRSKDGVALNAAGQAFLDYARMILRNWEEARSRVSLAAEPLPGFAIGAEASLWPSPGFRWLDALRREAPGFALRCETGRFDDLGQQLLAGQIQAMLAHAPLSRPGIEAEPLFDEPLVLVASAPGLEPDQLAGRYILVDWGPEFSRAQAEALPQLQDGRVSMAPGLMAGPYLQAGSGAAYLPARDLRDSLQSGKLHLVKNAPVFQLAAWVMWREDISRDLHHVAATTLKEAANLALTEAKTVTSHL